MKVADLPRMCKTVALPSTQHFLVAGFPLIKAIWSRQVEQAQDFINHRLKHSCILTTRSPRFGSIELNRPILMKYNYVGLLVLPYRNIVDTLTVLSFNFFRSYMTVEYFYLYSTCYERYDEIKILSDYLALINSVYISTTNKNHLQNWIYF